METYKRFQESKETYRFADNITIPQHKPEIQDDISLGLPFLVMFIAKDMLRYEKTSRPVRSLSNVR
jgi:hypothetical protein